MRRQKSDVWEKTLKELLGDENPCEICLVKVTCVKSFTGGSACEKLRVKVCEVLEKVRNENKN